MIVDNSGPPNSIELIRAIKSNTELIRRHCNIPSDSFLMSLFRVIYSHLALLENIMKKDKNDCN